MNFPKLVKVGEYRGATSVDEKRRPGSLKETGDDSFDARLVESATSV